MIEVAHLDQATWKRVVLQKSCESRNCSENVLILLMVDDLLGDVSGAIRATPSAEAARWAPDLAIKFSSVQVRPESQ